MDEEEERKQKLLEAGKEAVSRLLICFKKIAF